MISWLLDRKSNSSPQAASGPYFSNGTPNPASDFWYTDDIYNTDTGELVNSQTSMRVSGVLACVRVLAESISSLPVHLYERQDDGTKGKATQNPLYDVIHSQPNAWQTAIEFYDLGVNYLTLGGNFMARRIAGRRGSVDALEPIDPRHVKKVYQRRNGSRVYEIDEEGDKYELDANDVLHVMGMSRKGLWGESVLGYARGAVGMAMAAERMGATLFKHGIRPSGAFIHPGNLGDVAFSRLQQSLGEHQGSPNMHRALVLEEGMKWEQMSVTPEDAQFLETRKFQLEEIARIFRVPLHMIQHLDRATFNNIEHLSIDFVVHTLRPYLVRFEQAMRRDLITQRNRFFVQFNVDGLLRGDVKSRYEAYGKAIQHEIMNSNEVRALENMNPRPGGDEYRNPLVNPQNESQPADTGNVGAIVQAYASDLANRIAAKEIHQLDKRAQHAKGDRDGFNSWAQEWYTKQAEWIDSELSAFCDACEVRESDRIALVESLTAGTVSDLCHSEDVPQFVEQFKKNRQLVVCREIIKLVV